MTDALFHHASPQQSLPLQMGFLPCPFCGTTDIYSFDHEHHPGQVCWLAGCNNEACPAEHVEVTGEDEEDARRRWNTRA